MGLVLVVIVLLGTSPSVATALEKLKTQGKKTAKVKKVLFKCFMFVSSIAKSYGTSNSCQNG